jgi:hypothetical protein
VSIAGRRDSSVMAGRLDWARGGPPECARRRGPNQLKRQFALRCDLSLPACMSYAPDSLPPHLWWVDQGRRVGAANAADVTQSEGAAADVVRRQLVGCRRRLQPRQLLCQL